MSTRDQQLFIDDILEAVKRIQKFIKGYSYEQFIFDIKTTDAVIRNLSIIGEAASKVGKEFHSKHPQVPWKHMIGLRNKVMHEYFGVDLKILWKTIHEDLPDLKKSVRKLQK